MHTCMIEYSNFGYYDELFFLPHLSLSLSLSLSFSLSLSPCMFAFVEALQSLWWGSSLQGCSYCLQGSRQEHTRSAHEFFVLFFEGGSVIVGDVEFRLSFLPILKLFKETESVQEEIFDKWVKMGEGLECFLVMACWELHFRLLEWCASLTAQNYRLNALVKSISSNVIFLM